MLSTISPHVKRICEVAFFFVNWCNWVIRGNMYGVFLTSYMHFTIFYVPIVYNNMSLYLLSTKTGCNVRDVVCMQCC